MSALLPSALNFAAFQACWFASILGAAAGTAWLGPVAVGLWMAAHLPSLGHERGVEWRLLPIAAALGWAVDSLLAAGGWLAFPVAAPAWGSPIWMMALWVSFAATLSRSLGWLNGRYAGAALLGLIGGPAAYYAGAQLGAVALPQGLVSALNVGFAWALALPALLAARAALLQRCPPAAAKQASA